MDPYLSRQRDHFNSIAAQWDDMVFHDACKIRFVLSRLDIEQNSSVLDVACGTGVLTPFLSELAPDGIVKGCDISENMIGIAQSKHGTIPNAEYTVADVLSLSFQNCFDYVIAYTCFPHFEDKLRAVSVFSSYLKPGGRLCIFHSQSREQINRLHQHSGGPAGDCVLPTMEELQGIIKLSNLDTVFAIDTSEIYAVCASKQS